MKYLVLAGVVPAFAGLIIGALPAVAQDGPTIEVYETPGNLESTGELGCITLSEASSDDNPVALMTASRSCFEVDDLEGSTELYLLAMIYGRFDTERVPDRTAHQAIIVIRMGIFGGYSEDELSPLMDAMMTKITDEAELATLCTAFANKGPPTYDPAYMRQHGMGAFLGTDPAGGESEDFDAEDVYSEVLFSYMHCPGTTSELG